MIIGNQAHLVFHEGARCNSIKQLCVLYTNLPSNAVNLLHKNYRTHELQIVLHERDRGTKGILV